MLKTFIAKITGREIKKNKGGPNPVRLLQAEVTSRDDVQTIELLRQAGIDSSPNDDARIFGLSLSPAWKVAFGIDDGVAPVATPGELILYSQLAGAKKSIIKLNTDGSINITTTSAVNVVGDVIADGISLKEHKHLGNLGFDTSSPVTSPTNPPATPPSSNANGDIIGGDSVNLSTHTHSQGNDSNGDTEQNTSAPL